MLGDRDGGSPALVTSRGPCWCAPFTLQVCAWATGPAVSSLLVQLNWQCLHSTLNTIVPQYNGKRAVWRNAACLGKLSLGSVLCPMGLGATNVTGGGDGDIAALPPQRKRGDELFVLPWPIGGPPGSAWTSAVSLAAPWFQVLTVQLVGLEAT